MVLFVKNETIKNFQTHHETKIAYPFFHLENIIVRLIFNDMRISKCILSEYCHPTFPVEFKSEL